jgi:hypothetical protein
VRLTARGRGVLAVVLVALVGAAAFLLFRPGPTGAPPPAQPAASATTPPTGTAATPGGDAGTRPVVAWAASDGAEQQVFVDRGDGLEVVYVTSDAHVRLVGWFGRGAPDRLVLLVGQDLFDLVAVDLSSGTDTPLDPRPAHDAWTDEDGEVVAVLAGDEGGYRQLQWDATGAVVADDEVDAVPEHDTPGAAATPPATLEPSPGFAVAWAGSADSSTLTVDGAEVADGTLTSVLVWPAVSAPRGP